jgi:hypothetical protein
MLFVTPEDSALISRIVDRAMTHQRKTRREGQKLLDRMTIAAYVTICHRYACPLDLAKLASAPDPIFGHDITGIYFHLDPEARTLRHCFVPRCAAKITQAEIDRLLGYADEPDADLLAPEVMDLPRNPDLARMAGKRRDDEQEG